MSNLTLTSLPQYDPPQELWPRIVTAHTQRQQKRQRRRVFAAALTMLFISLFITQQWIKLLLFPLSPSWQQTAQNLEQKLEAMPLTAALTNSDFIWLESELSHIDNALQTAYDHHADPKDLEILWRQRSEVLNALLTAHTQYLAITRI